MRNFVEFALTGFFHTHHVGRSIFRNYCLTRESRRPTDAAHPPLVRWHSRRTGTRAAHHRSLSAQPPPRPFSYVQNLMPLHLCSYLLYHSV
jgi:hypothetical protein